uniref:Uncharacterized protein n=1 Tax=Romanomermis culicivorax TaxID=13658 RepID=A0A915ID30_ROMCU
MERWCMTPYQGCSNKAWAHLIAAHLSCNLPVQIKANRNITTLDWVDKRKISKSKLGGKPPCKDDLKNIKPKVRDIEFEDEDPKTQVLQKQ